MPSISRENYLKTIFHLSQKGTRRVTTTAVSEALSISNPAISDMAKKMEAKGWIDYKKYRGMQLTEEGTRQALRIIRKHRLWETFLQEVLGYRWEEVHEEAEKLEHSTSDKLADRLAEFLGHPKTDPHGDLIPTSDGKWPLNNRAGETAIYSIMRPGHYIISRVEDQDEEFMRFITQIGIMLHKDIRLIAHFDFDHSKSIQIDEREVILSAEVSRRIFVTQSTCDE